MRNPLSILGCLAVILWLACPILADWSPGDGHKMHEPQLPDLSGWDVMTTTPVTLADDWQCSESGPVKDIHFWGSWKDGIEGNIECFIVSIYTDIPEDPPSLPYSRPGDLLWRKVVRDFHVLAFSGDEWEGWYDPSEDPEIILPDNHQDYVQYNIFLPEEDWFFQTEGVIYWLCITAVLENDQDAFWGWKSSINHFKDNAVMGIGTDICIAPDNGTGTVDLPAQCPYTAPDDYMAIIDGLPPGTWIQIDPTLHDFTDIMTSPGGSLGGEVHLFSAILDMAMTGHGDLAGFSRNISMPVFGEMHTGPRTPGDPVQTFPAEMFRLEGQVVGDPDFDFLGFVAGSDFGLPSPGEFTLTQLSDPDWWVESFFDITYYIEFVGAPGSALEGMSGITVGTCRMEQGGRPTTWTELYEPVTASTPITNAFGVAVNPDGSFADGFGENAFGDGWYFYPGSGWWNVWFYDHPFTYYRYKEVMIQFNGNVMVPTEPSWVEIAVNYSTDVWSLEQPPGDSAPPLPGVEPEEVYIGRITVHQDDFINGMFEYVVAIEQYNPEWISVDVRGYNFVLEGLIVHECIALGPVPLDLAFVITASDQVNCCLAWGIPGDADKSTQVNLTDILNAISYVYVDPVGEPQAADGCNALYDVNGDGVSWQNPTVNLTDILNMIAHVYVEPLGVPVLCCPPECQYPR